MSQILSLQDLVADVLHEIDDILKCNLSYDTDSMFEYSSLKEHIEVHKYNLVSFEKYTSGGQSYPTVDERPLHIYHLHQRQAMLGTTTLPYSVDA